MPKKDATAETVRLNGAEAEGDAARSSRPPALDALASLGSADAFLKAVGLRPARRRRRCRRARRRATSSWTTRCSSASARRDRGGDGGGALALFVALELLGAGPYYSDPFEGGASVEVNAPFAVAVDAEHPRARKASRRRCAPAATPTPRSRG